MSDLVNPSNYGVLPSGFSRMRFPEIRQAIIESLKAKTGLDFETRTDSVTGEFIDVFAERETVMWELCEAVYHAMYPISAFGVNLDHAVSFTGVRRLFAMHSNSGVALYGIEGTIVDGGAIVKSNTTQDNFILMEDVTITVAAAIDALVGITGTTITAGTVYWIKINATTYSYTTIAGDTTISIATALATLLIPTRLVINDDAATIRLYGIENVAFNLSVSSNINILNFGSLGHVEADNTGPIAVFANTITEIVTLQDGWTAVNNLTSGQIGREEETDDELRARYANGMYILGGATVDAIKATILQYVPGILQLEVYENDTNTTDADGRPPHSIEVIAMGGDPEDIAQQIFNVKSAGIDTFGSIVVPIVDGGGTTHNIHFNRPVPVYIWLNIVVNLYAEETFPANGLDLIQQIAIDTGNDFGIGKDVIMQRFFGPIYRGVSGIGGLTITAAKTTTPTAAPGAYSAATIAIAAREIAIFTEDHITSSVV